MRTTRAALSTPCWWCVWEGVVHGERGAAVLPGHWGESAAVPGLPSLQLPEPSLSGVAGQLPSTWCRWIVVVTGICTCCVALIVTCCLWSGGLRVVLRSAVFSGKHPSCLWKKKKKRMISLCPCVNKRKKKGTIFTRIMPSTFVVKGFFVLEQFQCLEVAANLVTV